MKVFLDCKGKFSCDIESLAKRNGLAVLSTTSRVYPVVMHSKKTDMELVEMKEDGIRFQSGLHGVYDTCDGSVYKGYTRIGDYHDAYINGEPVKIVAVTTVYA